MTPTDPIAAEQSKSNRWELKEKPFTSSVPVIGSLIVGIRNAWNSVATKWYVRPIVEQQNQYNRLLAEQIEFFYSQLVDDARENSEISHDIAEISTLLTSMNRSLDSLDKRLSRLEEALNKEKK